ncbi:hypothetical protein F1D05_09530 [Kribbella qitaiheensis]|uniref:Uncharacterized protein n=1 Tax=Kribbella qitaiheensis TaxID=1544730 RepID=A0A7G6WVR7_9ACTN|nr:hypothetical protein [Kribbella qitaiheensis]QNE18082.1 hypothetical protein F1D05_09530 [Kribbella qitaiheensis]
MSINDRFAEFTKAFRLDSHHAIERFGLFVGALTLIGAFVLIASGVSALMAGRDTLAQTGLWTPKFTTSKTQLSGVVDGIYTDSQKTKVLVMMHFDDRAKISYNATDYRAFLLGSDEELKSERLRTPGITGSFYVFGATGYVGVVLEAEQSFAPQVLNLTIRANAELSFSNTATDRANSEEATGDKSFAKYDQWRVFVNPGASGSAKIDALDAAVFDPARAYYEVALKSQEDQAHDELDEKLGEMRTNLTQISSYSKDLATTKVDGLFLRQPVIPAIIAGDRVTGETKVESKTGEATLALHTSKVVPGGFEFDWRSGNVGDGYLDQLVPKGESYVEFLQKKTSESSDANSISGGIGDIEWVLSNGKNLATDYRTSDITLRPLATVMNNLSQAYQDYYANKSTYQSDLLLDLLKLEVDLRDVRSNTTIHTGEAFLVTYY